MSAGPVKTETSNIPGANKHTNGVLTQAPPVVRMPARTNISSTSSTYQTAQAVKQPVAAKEAEVSKTQPVAEESDKAAPTKQERQAKRASDWSALEEARKLKREAEQLKREAASFEEVKKSPQKLQALAKSLGLSTQDLILQLNNELMSVPSDKKLTPAEQQALEAKQYQERLVAQEQRLNNIEFMTVKNSHINKAILPELVKNPTDFEFCHKYGIDRCASEVYDYCDELHRAGKPQSEVEVLKEFEQALFEEWETTVQAGKGLKKTSKYFDAKQDIAAEEALGATPSNLAQGQKLAQAAITQAAQEPVAKRIAKRAGTANLPSNVDMNKLAANNRLAGGVQPGATFDRNARKARVLGNG